MVQWMSGSGRAAALTESFLLNLGPLIKSYFGYIGRYVQSVEFNDRQKHVFGTNSFHYCQ